MRWYISIFTIIFSFLISSLAMSADWGILMIDLGKKDVSQGIVVLPSGGDGVHEPDTVGGKDCRTIPKVPPGLNAGNHIYFNIDSTVIANKEKEDKLWIAVEYYDKPDIGSTGILMDYDDKGDAYPNNAFALTLPQAGRLINFEGTEEWKIAIIPITQAEFKQQGNGADFRFHIVPYMSGKFSLDRVWASNKEFKMADLLGAKAVSSFEKITTAWGKVKNSSN